MAKIDKSKNKYRFISGELSRYSGGKMSHSGHETVMCQICGNIIKTCRCIDKNKPIRYEACKKCQGKEKSERGD